MMKKNLGILSLLIAVFIVTALCSDNFLGAYNLENLILRASLYGIISIGVAFVIISGGIDLSIGSVIGLIGCLLPMLITEWGVPTWIGLVVVLVIAAGIGLVHGLLITKLKLQPFVVTLCGLLVYRGIARWITGDATLGFGRDHESLRLLANGRIPVGQIPGLENFQIPVPLIILVVLGVLAAILLNRTIFGRYLLALGNNEQAARYSGINTSRVIISTYVICSLIAGLGGVLFALDVNSIQPAGFGSFYELYAIAAAVLGGCSLRGGEGSIFGVIIGAAIMQLLYNSIGVLGIQTTLEYAIIGIVILLGVMADEIVRRIAARRRADQQAKIADQSGK